MNDPIGGHDEHVYRENRGPDNLAFLGQICPAGRVLPTLFYCIHFYLLSP